MESPVETQSLTDRQERFVFEYLKDQNASAAAVRAGYSAQSRASQASGLMQNPAVRERVRMELQSLLAELGVSALDLMKERKCAAFFRAGRLFGPDGEVLRIEELEPEVRDALVISVDWRRGEPVIHWRMPNREPALRALERVHERLEKLNEAYYEKLERERRAEAPADFAEKPMVLSGSAQTPANTFVFSGVPDVTNPPASFANAEKDQVLSGSKEAPLNTDVFFKPPSETVPGATFESAQKPEVLSGLPQTPARPSVFARAVEAFSPNKTGAAPVMPGEGRLPLPGAATELLSRGAYNDSSRKYNSPQVR